MKRIFATSAIFAANIAAYTEMAVAQSAKAKENANCNASFLSCSGGGNAAPFGTVGSGGLELLLVGAIVLVVAWRPLARKMAAR